MEDDIYQNLILVLKEYLKAPLTLHQLPIKKDAIYGYCQQDAASLFQHFAKKNNAFYFDIVDFLEAIHLNDQKRINRYKQNLLKYRKIITPELPIATDNEQKELSTYWLPLFTELKDVWKDPSVPERRLVLPLHLMFGNLIQHASVACFNFKPQQDAVDVIVLEQHAQKKGQPDYEADVDYTEGIKHHAGAFSAVMRQTNYNLLGIKTVNTFVNDKPICRRHNVCGVVASELARRLLEADDPMALAKSGMVITPDEVDKLHARNQKLQAKYGHFPLMVIHKNGGRK